MATQRVLEAMNDETWRAPIRAYGCREIRQLVRLQLFEVGIHGIDVTGAIGAQPVWENALGFLLEFVVRAGPKTMTRRKVEPEGALRINSAGQSWTLDGRDERWALTDEPAPAMLKIEAADLVLAVTGRASVDDALGRATIEGDPANVKEILNGWQVLAQP